MRQIWRRFSHLFGAGERRAADAATIEALFATDIAGIAQLDFRTGKFTRVNGRLCEMLWRGEQELLALGPADVQHPEDSARLTPGFFTAMASRGKWEGDMRHLLPDGGIVWARVSCVVTAWDEAGAPATTPRTGRDRSGSR